MNSDSNLLVPIVFALAIHIGAIALLGGVDEPADEDWDDETTVVIEPPPPEPPKPEPPKPEPPEPVIEKPAVATKVVAKPIAKSEPKRTPPPVVADEPDPQTASGDPDLPAPGGTYKMSDIVPGGAAMGGVGSSASSGKGGSGSGSAKGGDGGSGRGNSKPVSIASLKKKAIPINNRDVIGDRRFNDVAGDVVVKLVVDASGRVIKTTLIKRLRSDVDKVALGWAKKLRFKPAIDQDDKPVKSALAWTFTFRPPT